MSSRYLLDFLLKSLITANFFFEQKRNSLCEKCTDVIEDLSMSNNSDLPKLDSSRKSQRRNHTANEWIEEPADPDEPSFFNRRNSTMRGIGDDSSILTSMSFASLQIPECKPAEGEQEIDKRSFEQWRNILEASMKFSGITEESVKINVFRMKAGPKLIDVLEGTVSSAKAPDEETLPYSNVMYRLKELYGSRDYTLLQRQKLRSMTQGPTEGDVVFVKRVVAVGRLCDYGTDQLMESVADVVQSHATNVKVREAARKIIRKGGTIAELLDKVRSAEIERQSEELYAKSHQQPAVNVAAVSYASSSSHQPNPGRYNGHSPNYRGRVDVPRTRWGPPTTRGGLNRTGGGNQSGRTSCNRCGSNFHHPDRCNAIEKVCHRCRVKGHIERACPGPESSNPGKRYASDDPEPTSDSKLRKIAVVTDAKEQNDNDDKKPVSDLK